MKKKLKKDVDAQYMAPHTQFEERLFKNRGKHRMVFLHSTPLYSRSTSNSSMLLANISLSHLRD